MQEQGCRHPFTLVVGFCKTQELIRALQVLYGYAIHVCSKTEADKSRSVLDKIGAQYYEALISE